MPSPIKFKRQDPNKTKNRNRGQGWYYKRGGYKRGWFSQFTEKLDAQKRPKTINKNLSPRYEHTADKNRKKSIRVLRPSKRAKGQRIRGYL